MYSIVDGTTYDLPDVAAFLDLVNTLEQSPLAEAPRLFDQSVELVVARAPGRLDVMGGIADYSGSLVLEMPLGEATFVALQRDASRQLRVVSLSEDAGREMTFEMSLDEFESEGRPISYNVARQRFQQEPAQHWSAYIAGVFLVLMRERQIRASRMAHAS
jgi:galactokinase